MSMMYKYTIVKESFVEKLPSYENFNTITSHITRISHTSPPTHLSHHTWLTSLTSHITHISHTSLTSLTLIFGWCVTFRGKHNLWWCRNVTFHGKRNICMVILECHFSWQAQHLVILECHFSWQVQYTRRCWSVTFRGRGHFSRQAQHVEILVRSRSTKRCILPYKVHLQCAKKTSANGRVRDDQFMLGSFSDHARIVRHCTWCFFRFHLIFSLYFGMTCFVPGAKFGDVAEDAPCVTKINHDSHVSCQPEFCVMVDCHFSWQAQHLVMLQCHVSWQAQHLVTLQCLIFNIWWCWSLTFDGTRTISWCWSVTFS